MSHRKTLTFDEDNINVTFHPKEKDYGMMKVTEANTPYPRHEEPVDAILLRERLEEQLAKAQAYSTSSTSSLRSVVSPSSYVSGNENPANVLPPLMSVRTTSNLKCSSSQRSLSLFELHRRDMDHAEHTMAKQRLLSDSMHMPLRTLDESGLRIGDGASHIFMNLTHSEPSLLTLSRTSINKLIPGTSLNRLSNSAN